MSFYTSKNKQGYRSSTSFGSKEDEYDKNFADWGLIDPDDYHKVFGKLAPVEEGSTGNLFANGRRTHDNPLIRNKSVEVMPNVFSFDPDYIRFLGELANNLNSTFKVSLDDGLFSRNSVTNDFSRLKCISGTYQSPMSYILKDNDHYRETLGLPLKLTNRQREIYSWVFDIAFSGYDIETVKVPKKSTGGMPRFTSDAQWKITYARWLLDGNVEKMLDVFSTGDSYRLVNDFEIIFGRYVQKRAQVDEPDKVRNVFSYEFAISGGRKGDLYPADKRVVIDGIHYPGYSPMRDRVIHAYSWSSNVPMLMCFNGHLKSLFRRFPRTFSVNTAEQLKETFDGHYVEMSDVSQYDNTIPREIVDLFVESMRKFWDPRLVDYFERMIVAPYFTRPLGDGYEKGRWIGNPMTWVDEFFAGNPSGLASTSFMAKTVKIAETLCIVDNIYGFKGPSDIEKYLNHGYSLKTVNNGDDEGTGSKFKKEFEEYKALRANPAHSIFKVEPEKGQVYSGLAMIKPDEDKLEYFPQQRLHIPFEKMFVPERSIGGPLRQYAVIGMMERWENLSRTEEGREASEIAVSTWNNNPLARRAGSLSDITAAWVRDTPLPNGLNDTERMLYINPEYLHYRDIDMDDVRDGILGTLYSNIPKTAVHDYVVQYYTGEINDDRH